MVKSASVIFFLFIIIYGNNMNKIIISDYYFKTCFISAGWKSIRDSVVVLSKDSTIHDKINDVGWIYEDVPYFKGSLHKFVKKHLQYPPVASRDTLEGKVYVEFIVDTNGLTSCHKIIKGIRLDMDEEALRVTRLIKFDRPAMQRGQPVEMKYYFPIVFELSKSKKTKKK